MRANLAIIKTPETNIADRIKINQEDAINMMKMLYIANGGRLLLNKWLWHHAMERDSHDNSRCLGKE